MTNFEGMKGDAPRTKDATDRGVAREPRNGGRRVFATEMCHEKRRRGLGPRAVEFYFGMFFSVALSGLKSLEIYDPGVPLTLHPRLYTVALSGLSSQASICFFESTIRSSIFRTRQSWGLAPTKRVAQKKHSINAVLLR